jgi:hypothetical protein
MKGDVPMGRSTERKETEKKITVLNPRGNPPSIQSIPMAVRPERIGSRPVYLVDVRFMNGDVLLKQLQSVLEETYPEVKTVFRQKQGGYAEDDPALWAEIKGNNGLMVMGIGH